MQSTNSDLLSNISSKNQNLDLRNFKDSQNAIGDDFTSFVNSNPYITPPSVSYSHIDNSRCIICGKSGLKHLKGHILIHSDPSNYYCSFINSPCQNKQIVIKKLSEFKMHLLKNRFRFDNIEVNYLDHLKDIIMFNGTCQCGTRFKAKEWIQLHILTDINENQCPDFLSNDIYLQS